jgi:membrane associated rhomboid family serine protease
MIPLKTDRPIRRPILVNHLLIAANVIVMIIWLLGLRTSPETVEKLVPKLVLDPENLRIWQFITSMFMHSDRDMMHLLGNMLFLWVFGPNLEDRMGRIGYLAFYLGGGIVAGLAHVATTDAPAVGASGAISAVTGGFLVLFPRTRVVVLWFFLIITTFWIPSMWLIGFSLARDIFGALRGTGNVAYEAHLGGTFFGIAVCMVLLWTKVLARDHYDLLSLLTQARRRRQFKELAARGNDPWSGRMASNKEKKQDPPDPVADALRDERNAIAGLIRDHQLEAAAKKYRELLAVDAEAVLAEQAQLDIANQYFSTGDYDLAARTYELFLGRYREHHDVPRIELILGLIYVRYANNPDRARELLTEARSALPEGEHKTMADEMLKELT